MSDFKAKMHKIRFPMGLCPRPHWGILQRSPIRPSCIQRGLLLRGGIGKREERGSDGEEGREGRGAAHPNILA